MIQIDMKKPNHCLRCPMRGVDDECVLIRGSENFFGWEEQYANCPLQEVEPERKNGKWIPHEGGKFVGFPYMHYECSECRAFEPTETNFCPNCGADMRGDSDE